jgi:hypothetical protein
MSEEYIQAAEQIERLARQYEPMVTAAAILKRWGSLEQAEHEMGEKIAALRSQADAAQAEASAELERAAAARGQADRIDAEARGRAAQIVANAEDAAAQVEASSKAAASAVRDAADADRRTAAAEVHNIKASLASDVMAAKDALRAVQGLVGEAKAELAALKDKIAGARATIAQLLA